MVASTVSLLSPQAGKLWPAGRVQRTWRLKASPPSPSCVVQFRQEGISAVPRPRDTLLQVCASYRGALCLLLPSQALLS